MIESPKNFIEQFQNFIEHIAGVMKTFLTKEKADNYYLSFTAQTLTDEQKERVVENLTGTFLPLSGGTMTGQLVSNIPYYLRRNTDDDHILILGSTQYLHGGHIALFGKDFANDPESRQGGFELLATDGSVHRILRGKPNGSLTWNNTEVERVSSAGAQYIRLTSGLQICWGYSLGHQQQFTVTLPVPFLDDGYKITVTNQGSTFSHGVGLASVSSFVVYSDANTRGIQWIAIGKWR